MKKDHKKTTMAALALLASTQGAPALAQANLDLKTLELLREESLSSGGFYASYTEPKRASAWGGGNYSRTGVSGSPHREAVMEGPVPSPVIAFEDHT